jgi:hypothetical protein
VSQLPGRHGVGGDADDADQLAAGSHAMSPLLELNGVEKSFKLNSSRAARERREGCPRTC